MALYGPIRRVVAGFLAALAAGGAVALQPRDRAAGRIAVPDNDVVCYPLVNAAAVKP